MNPHKLTLVLVLFLLFSTTSQAQKRRAPTGGRVAVVIDERLAALRATPRLDGRLVRRLSRGRLVAMRSAKQTADGLFVFVNLTSRTHGWISREALALKSDRNDEQRLLSLIGQGTDFDRIGRAKIFLEYFPRSTRRAEVLLLLGDAAEAVSAKLSRDATRRIDDDGPAVEKSYFLNHSGLDRYNRLGITFVFDPLSKRLHYNGAAWREILRRFPSSEEAVKAKVRLESQRQ